MTCVLPHAGAAVRSGLRAQIEAAVEAALETAHRLIALLDDIDGDPCLELEEPDNTAVEWTGRGAHRYNVGAAA